MVPAHIWKFDVNFFTHLSVMEHFWWKNNANVFFLNFILLFNLGGLLRERFSNVIE